MTTHHQKREILRLARSGHVRRLHGLLEKGVDVNFLDLKTGMTPLMTAAHAGRAEAVELLLEYGADPNLRATDNASALFWASLYGDLAIVEALLAAGANVNVRRETSRDEEGPAPIHVAISDGHEAIAIRLIDSGASVDMTYFDLTVLQYAQRYGRSAVIDHLHQRGVRK